MKSCIFLFLLIGSVCANPLIVYKWKNQCSYETGQKNKKIFFNDEVMTLKSRPFILHFNLCGNVSAEYKGCSGEKSVCLLENEKEIDVGNIFHRDPEGTFFLKTLPGYTNNRTCEGIDITLIGFSLADTLRKPKLIPTNNDCVYEILFPNPKISPKCVAHVGVGEKVDLETLKTSISVTTSKNRRFHFTLCGSDPNCDVGVSACEILENGYKVSLADTSSQLVSYLDNTKELSVRGSFNTEIGGRRNSKIRFDAVLTCNWTVEGVENAFYTLQTSQAKKYPFKMQSNFACIKFPLHCVLYDRAYTYNLTAFYNHLGYTKVFNTTNDMFVNVCGPLNLTNSQNLCSKTSAQVCEIVNDEYINRGSIFNDFKIINNKLELEIQSGTTCKENNTLFYTTKVLFECSGTDEGPILSEIINCVTYIRWKSPKACPYQEKSSCKLRTLENNGCIFNFDNIKLNLNGLLSENGNNYVLNDPNDPNIEYVFNICGGVTLDDAPCASISMIVVRNLSEHHLAKKYIAFGDTYWTENIDNNLQLTFYSGIQSDFYISCEAKILFKCSNDEKIIFQEKNECNYKFIWYTKRVCQETINPCKLNLLDKEIDFRNLPKRLYKIGSLDGQKNYTFHICDRKYELCEKNSSCNNYTLENKLLTMKNNIPQMVLMLRNNTKCNKNQEFNRVYFNFICTDPAIINNDHLTDFKIKDCDVFMDLSTNLLCSFKKPLIETSTVKKIIRTTEEDNETIQKTSKIHDKAAPIINLNCNLFNKTTKTSVNISDLRPFKVPFSDKCPNIMYNRSNKSIVLNYSTQVPCMNNLNYTYKILLNCSQQNVPLETIKMFKCSEYLYKGDSDVCSFFEKSIFDKKAAGSSIWVIIISSISAIFILVCIILILVYKRRKCVSRYFRIGYIKNGNL